MCGRVSEYVCGRCESQGYCTEACQEEHWVSHHDTCKRIRRQRRQERKERRRLSSLATYPTTLGAAVSCSRVVGAWGLYIYGGQFYIARVMYFCAV